jgi:hypothetical protein
MKARVLSMMMDIGALAERSIDLLEKGSMTLVTFADPEAGGDIVRG